MAYYNSNGGINLDNAYTMSGLNANGEGPSWWDNIGASLSSMGRGILDFFGFGGSDGTGTSPSNPSGNKSWWTTPIGQGDNATTPLQLGLNTGLGLLGLWNQNKQWDDQLEEARRQFNFSKSMSQSNFMNQGTNFLNQSLFQLEGLNAFNPNAGAERAANLTAAANQLSNAANNIGLNNAFKDQQNAISKYNTLAGN